MTKEAKPEVKGLAKMREAFPAHQISQLPKPTKAQTEKVKNDYRAGARCIICGAWHHPDVVHLDYVGHAALTDRLLEADIEWTWEPIAVDSVGLPALDKNGGMWIRLTVSGVTRLGYGSADGKSGGDAIKEVIGDALRNAAMRFGAALDLWHKGDLHIDEDASSDTPAPDNLAGGCITAPQCTKLRRMLKDADSSEEAFVDWLKARGHLAADTLPELPEKNFIKAEKALQDRLDAMQPKGDEFANISPSDLKG